MPLGCKDEDLSGAVHGSMGCSALAWLCPSFQDLRSRLAPYQALGVAEGLERSARTSLLQHFEVVIFTRNSGYALKPATKLQNCQSSRSLPEAPCFGSGVILQRWPCVFAKLWDFQLRLSGSWGLECQTNLWKIEFLGSECYQS